MSFTERIVLSPRTRTALVHSSASLRQRRMVSRVRSCEIGSVMVGIQKASGPTSSEMAIDRSVGQSTFGFLQPSSAAAALTGQYQTGEWKTQSPAQRYSKWSD